MDCRVRLPARTAICTFMTGSAVNISAGQANSNPPTGQVFSRVRFIFRQESKIRLESQITAKFPASHRHPSIILLPRWADSPVAQLGIQATSSCTTIGHRRVGIWLSGKQDGKVTLLLWQSVSHIVLRLPIIPRK